MITRGSIFKGQLACFFKLFISYVIFLHFFFVNEYAVFKQVALTNINIYIYNNKNCAVDPY